MENILSWLIWIPLIGVGVIAFIPRDKTNFIKIVAASATGIQFLLTLILWKSFDSSSSVIQFTERYEWIPSYNIWYPI